MKRFLLGLMGWVLLAFGASRELWAGEARGNAGSPKASAIEIEKLLSPSKEDRRSALKSLAPCIDIREELARLLSGEAAKYKGDETYEAPFYCLIEAVVSTRAFEAEDHLFSHLDYEVDITSIPMGVELSHGQLFSAAWALTELRTPSRKILNAIAKCKNIRELRLLTWVLYTIRGPEEAKFLLEREAKGGYYSPENFVKAMELLKRPSDLLPPLKRRTLPEPKY